MAPSKVVEDAVKKVVELDIQELFNYMMTNDTIEDNKIAFTEYDNNFLPL